MTRAQVVKKALLLFLVITSLSAFLIYLQNRIGIDRIRQTIIQAGFWGPLIYILLHLITHIVAPIQGSPLFIAGLAIFGRWAIVYAYLVNVVSSFTNFWIARKLGREIMVKLVGRPGVAKIDHIATHEGPKALIIMRLFQGWISDFVSYAAGLTSIKFPLYYLISVLVPLPWTISWFFLFGLIPPEQVFAWSLVVGGVAFIIPPVYYFLKHRTLDNRRSPNAE